MSPSSWEQNAVYLQSGDPETVARALPNALIEANTSPSAEAFGAAAPVFIAVIEVSS